MARGKLPSTRRQNSGSNGKAHNASDQPAKGMSAESRQMVRLWLHMLAGLVFAMVIVGGATRMTGSGLSITEWRPLMGAFPPLNEQDWWKEFMKYQSIPQYQILNYDISLEEFKTLYWWEWGHRQLGRFVGVVFGLGFLFLVIRRHLRGMHIVYAALLGCLGGTQAFVGWIMVASGLKPGMTAVEPIRLMAHLVLAACIFALLLIYAIKLKPRVERIRPGFVWAGWGLLLGMMLQIAFGALVAGNHAGLIYNTWPLMGEHFLPDSLFYPLRAIGMEALFDDVTLVQFNHRFWAYVLLALTLWHAWAVSRAHKGTSANRRANALVWMLSAQAGIGIATLVMVAPMWLALIHQGFAILVLAMFAVHAAAGQMERAEPAPAPAGKRKRS